MADDAAARDRVVTEHFHRPTERRFTAAERGHVTILLGGLTWKHETLLRSVFEAAGHRCDVLPAPDRAACQIGREHGNVGQCNPTYFTVGALIQHLRQLEARGLSRAEIVDRYVFFTAGTCGPCRFGMYEAEYRLALENAGFEGFRVLLFQQGDGVKATSGEAGLTFGVDFGMGALNAVTLGDVVHQLVYRIRPYETQPGDTDRAARDVVTVLARMLRERPPFDLLETLPANMAGRIDRRRTAYMVANSLLKIREHLHGRVFAEALAACRARLDAVDVDRLRVKPVVRITGEFWAQTTEGDGNFGMFGFLESEGAEVVVEPIGSWVMYLLFQGRMTAALRRGLDLAPVPPWRQPCAWLVSEARYRTRRALFAAGERFWSRRSGRLAHALGGIIESPPPQDELARLAAPFYNPMARGGEGHLEIGKTLYDSLHAHCHMVLSLKPFGCLPSTQSDGAQAAVAGRYPGILFLPIETAGDGDVHARSRVQMVLAEAVARARREFETALRETGRPLDDIRAFVADTPDLRRALYRVPRRPGVAGRAATFVLHVSELMARRRRARVPLVAPRPAERPS